MFTKPKERKMNKYQLLLAASVLTSITNPILAETFSYTAVSVSYDLVTEEIDGISEDLEGDGIGFDLSIAITPNIAFGAGYGTGSVDVTSGGTTVESDIDAWGIGILYHTPINNTADFVVGINLIQSSFDIKQNGVLVLSDDANGNSIYLGIRAMASNNLELNAFIDRTDIESSTSTDIEFGAAFYIDKTVSLNIDYSFDSDGNSLSFGATKYF